MLLTLRGVWLCWKLQPCKSYLNGFLGDLDLFHVRLHTSWECGRHVRVRVEIRAPHRPRVREQAVDGVLGCCVHGSKLCLMLVPLLH
jgi:hypothetical protein